MVAFAELGTVQRSYSVLGNVGRFRTRFVERSCVHTDWIITGVPLRQLVMGAEADPHDGITPVGGTTVGPDLAYEYLRTLLGTASTDTWKMPDGRVVLLCCSVDLDLGCGALTADLVRDDECVLWLDVAFQTCDFPLDLTEQEGPILTFRFDRVEYDRLIRNLLIVEIAR